MATATSQGAAINPATGKYWMHEHGPRGGDEINIPEAGKNYGWPVIGYGIDYSGAKIHEGTAKAGMEQPVKYWVPSIAPSGMAFYTGDLFPAWKGNLFVGALASQLLVRLEVDGDRVVKEERLLAVTCANASAMCAQGPTARCGCSPTVRTAACCAWCRRSRRVYGLATSLPGGEGRPSEVEVGVGSRFDRRQSPPGRATRVHPPLRGGMRERQICTWP